MVIFALGGKRDGQHQGLFVLSLFVVQVNQGIITGEPSLLAFARGQGAAQVIVANCLFVIKAFLSADGVDCEEQHFRLRQRTDGVEKLP